MDTVHECDRQTDGRTDRITITDTVQTASHGKNAAIGLLNIHYGRVNQSLALRPRGHRIQLPVVFRIFKLSSVNRRLFKFL